MTRSTLLKLISQGEDSVLQFKLDVTSPDSLAAELVAMSNGKGGQILLGVADDGSLPGLSAADVRRLNQLISNAATQNMRSPISPRTKNVPVAKGRVVIVIHVPEGLDKPYFDRSGVIWLKAGADKRRLNSREELRRLFQSAGEFHADELPTKAGIEKLDTTRFREFLHDAYQQPLPRTKADLTRLLQNMDLATADGRLNLAGALLFAANPERIKPQFILKAIRYPGTTIHSTRYLDTEDFVGPFRSIFDGAMAFILRNLRKEQASGGVNSPGVPGNSAICLRGTSGQRPGPPRLPHQRTHPVVRFR